MGGTGKTPLVKFIAMELQKRGFKPGLVSRGIDLAESNNADLIIFDIAIEKELRTVNIHDRSIIDLKISKDYRG